MPQESDDNLMRTCRHEPPVCDIAAGRLCFEEIEPGARQSSERADRSAAACVGERRCWWISGPNGCSLHRGRGGRLFRRHLRQFRARSTMPTARLSEQEIYLRRDL